MFSESCYLIVLDQESHLQMLTLLTPDLGLTLDLHVVSLVLKQNETKRLLFQNGGNWMTRSATTISFYRQKPQYHYQGIFGKIIRH